MVLALSATALASDYYKVYVTKAESNLCRDTDSGLYILTLAYYKYTYGEEAVLRWDGGYLGGELIFKKDSRPLLACSQRATGSASARGSTNWAML